jgi:hypothetical protein
VHGAVLPTFVRDQDDGALSSAAVPRFGLWPDAPPLCRYAERTAVLIWEPWRVFCRDRPNHASVVEVFLPAVQTRPIRQACQAPPQTHHTKCMGIKPLRGQTTQHKNTLNQKPAFNLNRWLATNGHIGSRQFAHRQTHGRSQWRAGLSYRLGCSTGTCRAGHRETVCTRSISNQIGLKRPD